MVAQFILAVNPDEASKDVLICTEPFLVVFSFFFYNCMFVMTHGLDSFANTFYKI